MRQFEAAHRAGNSHGAPSHDAVVGGVAARVEIHVVRGLGGRCFAEIDEGFAAVGHADEHESTASEVSGGRVRGGQGEADGHSCVDCVAAGFQHSDADVRGERFLRNNHAFARVNWFAAFGSLAYQEKRE